jgi:LysM repeat protein
MNHDHDLERLISRSLASRSDVLGGTSAGSVDDVHRRVDLRRGRRRHVAAFGATAMLAVGAFALTAVGSSDPTTVPLEPVDGPGGSDGPVLQAAWRCTGQLDLSDGTDAVYFGSCESTAIVDGDPLLSVPAVSVPLYPDSTIVCDVPSTDSIATMPCQPGPMSTEVPVDCSTMSHPADVTAPGYCDPIPTTTEFDPNSDDPVSSSDGQTCTPGTGDGVECALTGREQQYPVAAGDSLVSIALRYRISVDTLVAYNRWTDGVDHLLLVGDIVLIPPFVTDAGSSATTTTTIITINSTLEP